MGGERYEFEAPETDEEMLELFDNREYPDDLLTDHIDPDTQYINGFELPLPFVKLVNQVNSGLSPVIGVAGQEGRGKSMCALRIAEVLHGPINLCLGDWVVDNLAYGVLQFVERVRKSRRQALIFDEAGVNLNAKEWYSDFNRAVDQIIQTQRVRENVYIFVLPKLDELDKSIRKRLDYRITMESVGVAKIEEFEYNFGRIEGDEYKRSKGNVTYWDFDMPGDGVREEYRKREGEFKLDTLRRIERELIDARKEEERGGDGTMKASEI